MLKFPYRITPTDVTDVYDLSLTRKGWLKLTAISFAPTVVMWIVGSLYIKAMDPGPLEIVEVDLPAED